MTILFLDFDGVLHPQYEGQPTPDDELFCHLPRVEAVLRDFPTVDIVISSMWRYYQPLTQLRSHFADDMQPRIIDTTLRLARSAGLARREQEILDWLAATGRMGEPWVAIDDASGQFVRHVERLVACRWYEGVNDEAEATLRDKLKNACGS